MAVKQLVKIRIEALDHFRRAVYVFFESAVFGRGVAVQGTMVRNFRERVLVAVK